MTLLELSAYLQSSFVEHPRTGHSISDNEAVIACWWAKTDVSQEGLEVFEVFELLFADGRCLLPVIVGIIVEISRVTVVRYFGYDGRLQWKRRRKFKSIINMINPKFYFITKSDKTKF